MAIEFKTISSGYSTGLINENFEQIEDLFNNNFLQRDGVEPGEANQMEVPLDMNSYPIINVTVNIEDPTSLITVGEADARYLNVSGDSMEGPLSVEVATQDPHPIRKDTFDTEHNERVARENAIESGYQAGDANIQEQLMGNIPLEASAFSAISWQDQEISNSVSIPQDKNAWSIGPTISIDPGQSVTVGMNSFWTIVEGSLV